MDIAVDGKNNEMINYDNNPLWFTQPDHKGLMLTETSPCVEDGLLFARTKITCKTVLLLIYCISLKNR